MVKRKTPKTSAKAANPRGKSKRVWRRIYLREWMAYRDLTAEQLADKADVSEGLISQILSRKSAGSPDSLQKIADALDITVGELLDVKPEQGGRHARLWISDKDRPTIDAILTARAIVDSAESSK